MGCTQNGLHCTGNGLHLQNASIGLQRSVPTYLAIRWHRLCGIVGFASLLNTSLAGIASYTLTPLKVWIPAVASLSSWDSDDLSLELFLHLLF